jgi:hypothetical protein
VSGGIPSRGLLNAANIAPVLQEKIGREIEAHSIMPFLDGEVSGSGTLVTIDGVHGILTAGHVVRNWHDAKDEHPKRLGLVPYRGASTLVEEPLEHFGSFVTEADHSDALGPDLAFVRIPSPSGAQPEFGPTLHHPQNRQSDEHSPDNVTNHGGSVQSGLSPDLREERCALNGPCTPPISHLSGAWTMSAVFEPSEIRSPSLSSIGVFAEISLPLTMVPFVDPRSTRKA